MWAAPSISGPSQPCSHQRPAFVTRAAASPAVVAAPGVPAAPPAEKPKRRRVWERKPAAPRPFQPSAPSPPAQRSTQHAAGPSHSGDGSPAAEDAAGTSARDTSAVWTEYLQNLHSARSLDAVLDLAGSTYTLSKDDGHSTAAPPQQGRRQWSVRRPGSVTASQAIAAVDTLEQIGAWLQRAATTQGQAPRSRSAAQATNTGLLYMHAVKCQVVVRSVLQALIPLLQAQALPPKRLASLARAINTLASASSATNTRQRGSTGYLTASPAQQQDTRSTDGASTQAAATAAADGAVPVAVIAALPPGFAAAYEVAVSNALPVTSPEAYCYLLRAVSLDRCKRLLRASKHLSPHLAARAAQLAPLMSAEQVSITISCGAQLVWDPAQPWLATLLHRLTGLGEELTADNACAVLSALGKIRTGVPTAVQALLLDRVGKVLVQVGKVGEPVQASLNALQLSSALWSIARLGITPTETWLVRYSVCSFTALKEHSFTASQLANLLWAVGKLDWHPAHKWMVAYLTALERQLTHMTSAELAMIAWALGTIKFRPGSPLLSTLATSLATHGSQLELRQLSMFWLACARLNYRPNSLVTDTLMSHTVTLLDSSFNQPEAQASSRQAMQRDTAGPRGKGRGGGLGATDPVKRVAAQPGVHQVVANLCYSVVHLGLHRGLGGVLARALERAAGACMPHFNVVELGNVGRVLYELAQVVPTASSRDSDTSSDVGLPLAGGEEEEAGYLPTQPTAAFSQPAADTHTDTQGSKTDPPRVASPALVKGYLAASLVHIQTLIQASESYRPTDGAPQGPQTTASIGVSDSLSQTRDQTDSTEQRVSGAQEKSVSSTEQRVGGQGARGEGVKAARGFSSPAQFPALLLGAVMINGRVQPPEYWMRAYYRATQTSLRALPVEDLEVLCQALRAMRPAPTPPLSWVQAFADRRDVVMDARGAQRYLKQHLTLVLKAMRDAWQQRAAKEQAQSGGAGAVPKSDRGSDSDGVSKGPFDNATSKRVAVRRKSGRARAAARRESS